MNFSNPKPIKGTLPIRGNPIKSMFEKSWAALSMISLMVPGSTTKSNIASKNIGVLIFIVLIIWLSSCGVYMNIKWIIHMNITGDWFYYCSIPVAIFCTLQLLDIDKQLRDFASEKKIKIISQKSILEEGFGKAYSPLIFTFELYSFFWLIIGIVFYDRYLSLSLLFMGIASNTIQHFIKNSDHAIKIFIYEACISLMIVLFILVQHFI